MSSQEYKIITLNVNGLQNPIKRSKLITKMKREKQQIIFWQETHLSDKEHEKFKQLGFKNSYYSSYKHGQRRGVIILISNKVVFQISKQIRDAEGRFILVKGYIDHKQVTLLNVYRPPGNDKVFIKKIFDLIAEETEGILVCGGDWNIQLQPSLDSSNATKRINSETVTVKKLLLEAGMMDIWRVLNPTARQFTFFSHPHNAHSRIDYFFMFNSERHRILKCQIGVKDISDHAGVYLSLHLDTETKNTTWRLNTSLLNDPLCKQYIHKEFKEYLEQNDTGEVSPGTIWDAAKAVIRGKLIMWSSIKKREKQKRINDLLQELKDLEIKHMELNDPKSLDQIKLTKQNLNKIYDSHEEMKAKYIKQRYYDNGPRAKKLLAWRIRKQQEERSIHKIKDTQSGKMCHKLKEIQKSFEDYYKDLYTQPKGADSLSITHFLNSLDLPSIGLEQNKIMTNEITQKELDNAISRLKTNKMPGEDGYSAEWYKAFRELLSPSLLKCFNFTLNGGDIPVSWRRAIISVIPKVGKDKSECGSYRPISILNLDYKLYASIIAKRLENIIPDIIDEDQTGFLKSRQTQDNVRRALHLMEHMSKNKDKSVVLSLDAEKAFDSVSWKYLHLTLQRFGFDIKVVSYLKNLYHSPSARIKINGSLTDPVPLERGCRQGCPLSPTLFALFIEPLAQAIREDQNIKGIWFKGTEYKTCLYADDVLITLSQPDLSLPTLMSFLKIFGRYSGYKLNIHKTQVISFNYIPPPQINNLCNFKWENSIIKYLGIKIPKDLSTIYTINYPPITTEIKADLNRWSLLPLDLHNRIDIVKMNILPRLLFLFLSIPIEIPQKQLIEWKRMISGFIWRGLKPRIRYKTLQLSKEKGGLALPNIENYYKSAQLRYLIYLCDPNYNAKWKNLELSQLDIPLQSLLGDRNLYLLYKQNLSGWTRTPLNIWFGECRKNKLENHMKILRWVTHDKDFKPAQMDGRFKQWLSKGITTYCLISDKGTLHCFQKLKDKYDLENQDFFRYLQVRAHFNCGVSTTEESSSDLINILIEAYKSKLNRKLISKIYTCLQSFSGTSTLNVKSKWEKEAKITISENDWLNICKTQMGTSSSGYWREFSWKNIIRFFITPKIKQLQKGQTSYGKCWRECGNAQADHFHVFWDCPIIHSFWQDIMVKINSILGFEIKFDFCTIYLGDISSTINVTDNYLIKIMLVASKKAITRKWLLKESPSKEEWIAIVKQIYDMEKLTFSLNLNMDKFTALWRKWTAHSE